MSKPKKITRKFNPTLLVISLLSMILRFLIPPNIILNSMNDDSLAIHLAQNIENLHWLGSWYINTLAKPPGYSIFLALIKWTFIPPYLVIHLAALFISYMLSGVISKSQEKIRLNIFAILVLNPVLFCPGFSRYYQISLTCILIYLSVTISVSMGIQADKFSKKKYMCALMSQGFTLGTLYITRQGMNWFIYLTLMFHLLIILAHKKKLRTISWFGDRCRTFKLFLVLLLCAGVVPIGVGSANYVAYGYFGVDDFYSHEFANVSELWMSVDSGRPENISQPIDKFKRMTVYRISKNAAMLRPVLDGAPGVGWKQANCQAVHVCDESGAWFTWEFRDAIIATGQVHNEPEFQSYLKKIRIDIQSACNRHEIKCGRRGSSSVTLNLFTYPKLKVLLHTFRWIKSLFFSHYFTYYNQSNLNEPSLRNDFKVWAMSVNLNQFEVIQSPNNSVIANKLGDSLRIVYFSLFFLFSYLLHLKRRAKKFSCDQRSSLKTYYRDNYFQILTMIYLSLLLSIGIFTLAIMDLTYGFDIETNFYNLPLAFPASILAIMLVQSISSISNQRKINTQIIEDNFS